MKVRITKTLLWFLAGLGLTVLILRLFNGPGAVTALTDIIPWGLWKGGGVVALVALGGAGFTLAMFVYIFGWERYRPVVRGAVLLALLAYSSVGIGLTMDIGIWWRIVFPVFHWQIHSVLFEVAWCIMLYLVVLFLEFGHTVVERLGWTRVLAVLHKATLVFVILGISLSTLHQSSLGTLFLATPFRLHPLWYTDLLPLLFFITAIGVGCLAISLATLIVHWLYDTEPPTKAISGLGRIAGYVLSAYLVLRFAEIFIAGEGELLIAPTLDTLNFWVEILLGAGLPVALLFVRKLRESPRAMFWISLCAVLGVVLNRVNVSGLATLSLTQTLYWPAWTEWAMTFGIIGAAGLIYMYVAENFALFETITSKKASAGAQLDPDDSRALFFSGNCHAGAAQYSFAFVLAMAVSFSCLPDHSIYGVQPEEVRVERPRILRVQRVADASGLMHRLVAAGAAGAQAGGPVLPAYLIDGNRNGRDVLYDHAGHIRRQGMDACTTCHHMNKPLDDASSCGGCHRDMFSPADIFDHDLHETALGHNEGCSRCHTDPDAPKVRSNTTRCAKCHENMRAKDTRVRAEGAESTWAAGYMDAMHGLCIACHADEEKARPALKGRLTGCMNCHPTMLRTPPESEAARR